MLRSRYKILLAPDHARWDIIVSQLLLVPSYSFPPFVNRILHFVKCLVQFQFQFPLSSLVDIRLVLIFRFSATVNRICAIFQLIFQQF